MRRNVIAALLTRQIPALNVIRMRETIASCRLEEDEAVWLSSTAARHFMSKSRLIRLGLAMLREAWTGEARVREITLKEGKD